MNVPAAASLFEDGLLMSKEAVITVRLVDECVAHSNSTLAEAIREWFASAEPPVPWVKDVGSVVVRDVHGTRSCK